MLQFLRVTLTERVASQYRGLNEKMNDGLFDEHKPPTGGVR